MIQKHVKKPHLAGSLMAVMKKLVTSSQTKSTWRIMSPCNRATSEHRVNTSEEKCLWGHIFCSLLPVHLHQHSLFLHSRFFQFVTTWCSLKMHHNDMLLFRRTMYFFWTLFIEHSLLWISKLLCFSFALLFFQPSSSSSSPFIQSNHGHPSFSPVKLGSRGSSGVSLS